MAVFRTALLLLMLSAAVLVAADRVGPRLSISGVGPPSQPFGYSLGPEQILSLRFVGEGEDALLLCLQEDRLTDLTRRRSIALDQDPRGTEPHPLHFFLKVDPRGRQAAVLDRLRRRAIVIDLAEFRVDRVIEEVQDVGWHEGALCYLRTWRADDPERRLDRVVWVRGDREFEGPPGFLATAISEDGAAILAHRLDLERLADGFADGIPFALALLSEDGQRIERVEEYVEERLTIDPHKLDEAPFDNIDWNARLESAAVTTHIAAFTTAGVWVLAPEQRLIRLDELPGGHGSRWFASIPRWLDDRLLVSTADVASLYFDGLGRELVREQWVTKRLELINPFERHYQGLLETVRDTVVADVDLRSQRIAFAIRNQRSVSMHHALTGERQVGLLWFVHVGEFQGD